MNACGHDAPPALRVCAHLQEEEADRGLVRFSGRGAEHEYVCEACATVPRDRLGEVCAVCASVIKGEAAVSVAGRPAPLDRPSGLEYVEETISLDEAPSSPVIAVAVAVAAGGAWVALTADGQVGRLDLVRRAFTPLARAPEGAMAVGELALAVSDDGRFAAVYMERGRYGSLLDLSHGEETLRLDRGDYHETVSSFPVAFSRHAGRPVVVHGTDWNRLDVSDPETGARITKRDAPIARPNERSEHYLDYFHGALAVSPDGTWIAEDGWVWHPVGVPVAFSLERWLSGNVWESEDGPSRRSFGARDFWDAPLVWLDEATLGIWGGAFDMSMEPVPILERVRVESGERLEPIACPGGSLVAEDGRLYAFDRESGLSILDVATGERLLHRRDVSPTRYRGRGEFLTLLPGGAFRVGRVIGVR